MSQNVKIIWSLIKVVDSYYLNPINLMNPITIMKDTVVLTLVDLIKKIITGSYVAFW